MDFGSTIERYIAARHEVEPAYRFRNLWERTLGLLAVEGEQGGLIEIVGTTQANTPVSVNLKATINKSPKGSHRPTRRLIEAHWSDGAGEPIGESQNVSETWADLSPDSPHLLRGLALLEKSVSAAEYMIGRPDAPEPTRILFDQA